jgi:hypothetical protein
MKSFLLKVLQLAIVADQEYAAAKSAGTATLLQPGNFDGVVGEIAQIFEPATATPAPPATT